MTYDFTRTGPQIQAIHDTVSDPSTNQDFTNSIGEIVIPKYTDIVYKSSGGNSAVDNMVDGVGLTAAIGDVCSTGGTTWKRVSLSSPGVIDDFHPKTTLNVYDFGATGDGVTDDTASIQRAIDLGVDVTLSNGTFLYSQLRISKDKQSIFCDSATLKASNGNLPSIIFDNCKQSRIVSPDFDRNSPSDIGYYIHIDTCSGVSVDFMRCEDNELGFTVPENEQILGGVLITESFNCEVVRPRVLTFGKGVFIDGDSTTYTNACNQNTVRDGIVSSFNGPDIQIRGGVTNKVIRTNSEVSRYSAPSVDYGRQCHVYMNTGGVRRSQENTVEGLYYDGKGKHSGIVIEDGLYNKIVRSHINFTDDSTGNGKIVLTGAAANNSIIDNWFFNDGPPVLEEDTSNGNYIINNLIISGPSYTTIGDLTQIITPNSFSNQVVLGGGADITNGRLESSDRVFKFGGGSPDYEIQLRIDSVVSPNGVIFGDVGDIYINVSGGAGTTFFIKESGNDTNTGWVGK